MCKAVSPAFVLVFAVLDVLLIIWVPDRVVVPVVMLMDVALIGVDLPQSLFGWLGTIPKELPQVVVLFGDLLLTRHKVLALAALVASKFREPSLRCSIRRLKMQLLKAPLCIKKDNKMLLLKEIFKDLASCDP